MNTSSLSRAHWVLLAVSIAVLLAGVSMAFWHAKVVVAWLSHNWWVVILPFLKLLMKQLLVIKFLAALKAIGLLLMHLSKLLLLKGFNTLTLRYGVFFSQNRWYGVRKIKVMFLRRGRQFFAWLRRFWGQYATWQKTVVLLAFFPLVVVLFILGLSFNITRKTMVTQAQGGMVLKTAKAATSKNKGLTSWFKRIDQVTLAKIKQLQGKN